MKAIALGVVAGGATVAAFLTAAAANADTDTDTGTGDTSTASWAPVYDEDAAQLLQGPESSLYWSVPSTFTNGDTVLEGDTYITESAGGFNTIFVDDNGDIYAQNQLFPGFTNLYYDEGGDGKDAVDMLKTPFGTFDISQMAASFAPIDVEGLEAASPLETLQNAGLYSALNLGVDGDTTDLTWTPDYGNLDDNAVLLADDDPYSQTWQVNDVSFTNSAGDTLTGTNYVTQSLFGGIDDQFVTADGAVYDQDQLGFGFTNLYYDPGTEDGDIVDMLKTPFGTFDISWMADSFTPTDFSDAVPATALDDLADAGLYSALDLGLLTDVAP